MAPIALVLVKEGRVCGSVFIAFVFRLLEVLFAQLGEDDDSLYLCVEDLLKALLLLCRDMGLQEKGRLGLALVMHRVYHNEYIHEELQLQGR